MPDKVLASLQPKPLCTERIRYWIRFRRPRRTEVINDPTTDLPPIDTCNAGAHTRVVGHGRTRTNATVYRPPIDFQTNALLGGPVAENPADRHRGEHRQCRHAPALTPPANTAWCSVPSGVGRPGCRLVRARTISIYLRPADRPRASRKRYTLSADGRQLVVKIEVASEGRNPAMTVTRTYDRSSQAIPPPSTRPSRTRCPRPTDRH